MKPVAVVPAPMTGPTAASITAVDSVIARLDAERERSLEELCAFVRIPSVSADPAFAPDVRRAAEWLRDHLVKAGLDNVGLVETSGHPSVVADWMHAGPDAPTLLVYGHYDVQPAAKEDGWLHDPFGAVVDDERVWGRGTTDDKGQLMAHVFAAEAWLQAAGGLPCNVRYVFEGEEEVGSFHFGEVIDRAADRLKADLLIVSDSPMRGEDQPAITYSLRGLLYLLIDIEGPRSDLHSGTWGGVVWNPNEALAHMLASLKDPETGRVLVPGFYDDVVDPTDEERARLAEVADDDEVILQGTGSGAVFGESGWTNTERVGVRPTLEINGMWGGYTGEGAKTVIPRTAHAKVSCRLVAAQEPAKVAELVKRHLDSVAPAGIKLDVTVHSTGDAVRADPAHPLVKRVETALEATWGNRPVLLAEGGSIPAVADMQNRLGVVPILAGFGHKDEKMHAPDESFRLKNFYRGQRAAARMLAELARPSE